ncbi:ANTAR domain-containing protein [Streptomyces sp. NPDC058293]|uniref:ANTAR domain-containing protein n=1 Tax=Streptomyces sp. NPDC058293 TaxID=3346429 RepID=UPI0036F0FFC2
MGPQRRLHGLPRPSACGGGPAIRAIGIVVTLAGLRAEDGGDVLQEISQHTDIKMRHVAELILD